MAPGAPSQLVSQYYTSHIDNSVLDPKNAASLYCTSAVEYLLDRSRLEQAKIGSRARMKTFLTIVMLIVFGAVANFASVLILNIAGLPGALLAGTPGKRSKRRFVFGSVVSALGQSYVYLAFTAFVVNWTMLAARRDDVVGFMLWPFAFLVVFLPMWLNLIRGTVEAREHEHANPQVEALHLTVLATLLGFFIFAFAPSVMKAGWGWLPYMSK